MPFTICVVSGKGGVGKTTVAAALSKILARKYRVLAVDADVECPNLHILLKAGELEKVRDVCTTLPEIDEKRCIQCGRCVEVCRKNALFRRKEGVPLLIEEQCNGCKACFIVCPTKAIGEKKVVMGTIRKRVIENDRLVLLSGELEVGQEEPTPVVRELMREVEAVKRDFDFVVVDAAPGVKCTVATALEGCDHTLLVVEPTPFGVEDAKRVAERIKIIGVDAHVVINRSVKREEDEKRVMGSVPFSVICTLPYSTEAVRLYVAGDVEKMEGIGDIAKAVEKLAELSGEEG